jgi:uncharacterized protein with HEPN domain
MFSKRPEMHLRDILKAINLIEAFTIGMDFHAYRADLKTQAAVERQLQIVTEAAYRLKPEDEHLCPGPDWRKIRGMGNILRHDYDRIEDETIWNTVQDDIPALKQAVTGSLETPFPNTKSS